MTHLAATDPVMARLVHERGPLELRPTNNYFFTLVEGIASQQLASKAADTIIRRIKALVPDMETPDAHSVLAVPDDLLRRAGLSWNKVRYVKDLADHVISGQLPLDHISQIEDEEVIKALIAVKGIGRWTAEMFLMFSLARPDVLAVDDYGLRTAMQRLYSLSELPKPAAMREIGETWRPYRSYASLYLWHSHDNSPKIQALEA